jgi:hypothetical protein
MSMILMTSERPMATPLPMSIPFGTPKNKHVIYVARRVKRRLSDWRLKSLAFQVGTVEFVSTTGRHLTPRPAPVQPVTIYALDLTCSILDQVLYDISFHFHRQAAPRARIVLVPSMCRIPKEGVFACRMSRQHPFVPFRSPNWT